MRMGLGFFVLVALHLVGVEVEGSVHQYVHASFKENGNAFLLYGGSEGLRASSASKKKPQSGIGNDKSYIKLTVSVNGLSTVFVVALVCLWFKWATDPMLTAKARRRLAKLEIYRKFTNALAVAVIVSVAWIGYELYFKATDPFSERWQSAWIISAFWHVLSFALLCVLCVLWAPSQSSTRYAYSDEVVEDFDEEEAVALTTSASVAEGDFNSTKQEKKERKAVNTDVFSLDDDPEEDKRE